ncbi:MAG: membrane dipeptidase [Planctomycetota bacterium]|jgi:membrane dipeptidase
MRIVSPAHLGALFLCACSGGGEPIPALLSEKALLELARGVHQRVITLDTHNDISVSNFTVDRNYSMKLRSQVDLPKMKEGGLDVSWLIVYTGQGELNEEAYANAYETAISKFNAIHLLCKELAPDEIELALTSDEVREILGRGKKVAMIGIENAYPIGLDLSNIEKFARLGGRYMSLAHNGHSQFSDSNTGEKDDVWLHGGLSELGREAVHEMNKWGIMIDVSHPSREAMVEMAELTRAPLIASHSSARAMNDVSRNMDDEQLELLAKGGGVVQTVAFRSYLDTEKDKAHRAASGVFKEKFAREAGFELLGRKAVRELGTDAREAYDLKMDDLNKQMDERRDEIAASAPDVNVADFVDHIDHMVELIGIDHVGISSDFDGGGGVEGWDDASETLNVTLELVRRGYAEGDIDKLWSGNLLRVLDEVQAVAAVMQAEE